MVGEKSHFLGLLGNAGEYSVFYSTVALTSLYIRQGTFERYAIGFPIRVPFTLNRRSTSALSSIT